MSTIFLEKLNTHSVFEQLLWKLCCKQCVIWIVWKNIGSFFLYRFHFTFIIIITGRHFFTQKCQGFMPKYYIRENSLCFFIHKRKRFKLSPSWNSCCILNRDFTIEEKCVGDSIWLSLWRKPYKTEISHSNNTFYTRPSPSFASLRFFFNCIARHVYIPGSKIYEMEGLGTLWMGRKTTSTHHEVTKFSFYTQQKRYLDLV